jgi:GNAT superfamily N-acetyltransferase
MQLSIVPVVATSEEIEEMLAIFKSAFGPDPLMAFCYSRPNAQPKPQPKENPQTKHQERLANPLYIYHKAVNADNPGGPMLGVAVWFLVEDPLTSTQNIPWGDPAPEVHQQCYDDALGVLRRWRLNHFCERNQPFLYMALLTVAPEMQRCGVGKTLLREGLKEADRRGLPTFIEASPAGLGLYRKFGWEEMLKTTVNLKNYGGEDVECVTVGLIRPPNAKEVTVQLPGA